MTLQNKQPNHRKATDSEGADNLSHGNLKIGVAGCTGRVGTLIIKELLSGHYSNMQFFAGTLKAGHPMVGSDIGSIIGQAELGIPASDNADALFEHCDAVIDFTRPEATAQNIWLAAKHHTPLIIGTTGLNDAQEKEISDASNETPIVYAANMSVGVNLLLALTTKVAETLGADYDIEIVETHHKHKIDAPSGTALALGKAAAEGRKVKLNDVMDSGRHGDTGERQSGDIGFAVMRGGDVVGEHTVYFYGEGERVELTHKATDRRLFAKGALRAAEWACHKAKRGEYGLYSMLDVLDL